MLTIIGDVHGKYLNYDKIVSGHELTLQIGDMGFDYSFLDRYIDPNNHKFIGGNHDNYDILPSQAHSLGDFGSYAHGVPFYYVRGGYSIDLHRRSLRLSWWPEEELPQIMWDKIIDDYARAKPEIMITHECPRSAIQSVSRYPDYMIIKRFGCSLPSQTSVLLQLLLEQHQPKHWYFGHYHVNRSFTVPKFKTRFRCIKELGTYEICV